MPETEGSTHHREAGAGPGVKKVKKNEQGSGYKDTAFTR